MKKAKKNKSVELMDKVEIVESQKPVETTNVVAENGTAVIGKVFKPNTYKTVRDLANYIDSAKILDKEVMVDDVYFVFQKCGLFIDSDDMQSLIPSPFFKNSNGVFVTHKGRILFTDACFKAMTEDTKDYTKEQWLNWFKETYYTLEKDVKKCPAEYYFEQENEVEESKEETVVKETKKKKTILKPKKEKKISESNDEDKKIFRYAVTFDNEEVHYFKASTAKEAKEKAKKKYKDAVIVSALRKAKKNV